MVQHLVYVIADYGDLHDLAFAEVTERLYAELPDLSAHIKAFSVPAFDTVATGFVLAQTAINSKLGKRHKFYVNTAPRKDDLSPRVENSGEGLAYVRLQNGVEIVAVNSGHSLSYLKPAAEEMREINCEKHGSQFRSRDIFPASFGKIMAGNYEELGADIAGSVPDPLEGVVNYTDGYGNLKCAIPPERLAAHKGRELVLDINGRTQVARVSDGIFGVADGQICVSRGSAGWNLPDGTEVRFTEVVQRGGNAAKLFGRPPGGIRVDWREIG